MKQTTVHVSACVVFLASVAFAQESPPVRDHDITLDDYFTLAVVTECSISPNGKHVAYVEQRWEPPAEKRNTDLWVVEPGSGEPASRRLTFDPTTDGNVRWSGDGKYMYFTSAPKRAGEDLPPYNGKKQVWRMTPDGDEPFAVTRVKKGIDLFDLALRDDVLYYTTSDERLDDEWKDLRKQYSSLKYGHGVTNFSILWKLDLNNWRSEKLVDERRVIRSLAVSPDERRIATVTTPDEELIFLEGQSRVDIYYPASGIKETVTPDGWRDAHPSPYGWIEGPVWSQDGALAFTVSFDGFPVRVYVVEWAKEIFTLHEIARPEGVSVIGGSLQWRGGSRDLCFIGEERARARVFCIRDVRDAKQGPVDCLTPTDLAIHAFDFPVTGEPLHVLMGRPSHPEDIFIVRGPEEFERLTNVNPQVNKWKLPQISVVEWKGAGGDPVEGILELPPGHEPGRPLPMIVEIHGGPTAATRIGFQYWIYGRTWLPAKGYAVFSPNYRGSTGYGDKFMTDLVGRENGIEVEDILRGVDALVDRGIADPDRLGVMGWSNGGFLTNCLITATDRFKAASSGAGVLDMVIQWGTEDTPGHVINFMQAMPWTNADAYRLGSPIYKLDKVRTPTLIHVGENDERVPAAHARALYRALRHYLNVPVELIVYPGEGHGLTEYEHRKAKMEWDVAWFDKYLKVESPAGAKPDAATAN
jgi:dipeptidyl aminopeptidase/acylaminoacyl peptidase